MSYEQEARELESYIRPAAFPMAVRVLKKGEELPPKVRQPYRDLKVRISICQAMGMARRYGWTIALGPQDQSCPIAQVAMGFGEALPFFTEGNLAHGMYAESMEASTRAEAEMPEFAFRESRMDTNRPSFQSKFRTSGCSCLRQFGPGDETRSRCRL